MRLMSAALLLLPGLAVAQPVSPVDLLKEDVPAAEHRLSYGTSDLHVGELRLPSSKDASGRHPVVVLVHGGWPGTFEDLALATDFLRSLAPKHNLDLARVVVAGHSSGGHLAMWIAARPRLPTSSPVYTKNPLPVKAVMNLDGPADPAAMQPLETKVCGMAAVSQFLGGTPAEQPDRYRDASPLSFLPLGIPQEFVAGGMLQRLMDQITAYQSAAREKGDTVTITTLDKAGHFDMLQPRSTHWKTVEDRFKALVR